MTVTRVQGANVNIMSASERRALVHTLSQNRLRFERQRAQASAQLRRLAGELERLDRRLNDIEQSIDYLAEEG